MEADPNVVFPGVEILSLEKAALALLSGLSQDKAWEIAFVLFRAWANLEEEKRSGFTNEEIALFLDRLMALVAATSQLHRSGGGGHD